MKIRTISIITGVMFLIAAILGVMCKNTFTNYNKLAYFNVGELPGNMIPNLIKNESKVLEGSKYILKVTPLKDVEFDSLCTKQKVKVLSVFKGENVGAGDEFYVIKSDASLNCQEPRDTNMNFVNEMKGGQDYLVFLDRKLIIPEKSNGIFFITPQTTIPPIYSYNDRENVIIPIPEDAETTYVAYEKVRDNEFFVTNQNGLDELNAFKKELTDKYK